MPPTDPESGTRTGSVLYQLTGWALADRRGKATGPDAGFYFPDGSRLSPDAAWFDDARWKKARSSGKSRFPVFSPEFVIEVSSPGDRLRPLQEKMEKYIENGVQLGWLVDPTKRLVTIYRSGGDPEILSNPKSVAGEGPVAGFVLDLAGIL